MKKVILQEFVSLDGLAAGRNDNVDFVPASTKNDRQFGQEQLAFMETIDTILLGRITYQMFAGYWPNVTEGEDKSFADRLNAIPKIVFSKTLARAPWGEWPDATIVRNKAADEVAKLKDTSGKDMVIWGSISLAQSLIQARLIDEYRLVFCPVVLGGGRRLFPDGAESMDMTLATTKALDRGGVTLHYLPRS
jgi:dihydrofolate reductase